MIKTVLIKLNARKHQIDAFENHFAICLSFYNHFLQQRIDLYTQSKKNISCFAQQKLIKEIRQIFDPEQTVHTHILQDVCKRIHLAYQNFFRRVKENISKARKAPGFPRFKNKIKSFSFKEHKNGYEIICQDNFISKIKISNIGKIKVFNKFKLPSDAKFLVGTLQKKADGYYFSLTYETNLDYVKPVQKSQPLFPYSSISHKVRNAENSVGIDVGIKDFITSSDGDKISCKTLETEFDKIRKLNRIKQNKKKQLAKLNLESSRRLDRLNNKIAKQHLKIARIRDDFQHKVANFLISNYDEIYIEKLNIGRMIKTGFSRDFRRRIHSASWSKLFVILKYKAENANILVREVDAAWTSQICPGCLNIAPKALNTRLHDCNHCGLQEDRDVAAAKVIKISGLNPELLSVPKARLVLLAQAKRITLAEAPASTI